MIDLKTPFLKAATIPVAMSENFKVKNITPRNLSVLRSQALLVYSGILGKAVEPPPDVTGVIAAGVCNLVIPQVPRDLPAVGNKVIKAMGVDVTFGGGDAVPESSIATSFVVKFHVEGVQKVMKIQGEVQARKGRAIILFADYDAEVCFPVVYEHGKIITTDVTPTFLAQACSVEFTSGPNGLNVSATLLTNKHDEVVELFEGAALSKALKYDAA